MEAWSFTEQPYPAAWDVDEPSLRATLPNLYFDPKLGADLYHRYLDDWAACDELGLNLMVNEHHASATYLTVSCTHTLVTKKARFLSLGINLANRPDPIKIAEESLSRPV
jgi:hypothetical protein